MKSPEKPGSRRFSEEKPQSGPAKAEQRKEDEELVDEDSGQAEAKRAKFAKWKDWGWKKVMGRQSK